MTLAVEDNGPGIPDAELEAVLRPFYRLDLSPGRDSDGAGLGLAITADIVRSLAGDIHLSNKPKGGLKVELIIPVTMA